MFREKHKTIETGKAMNSKITDRQLEIIEAAGKILSASGVAGLTIKNLAKEMHFSESAIYRHFASKEDIIVAMLEYLAENMDKRYTIALSHGNTPEEKFQLIFRSQFSFFAGNPHFVVAVFSDGLMGRSERVNRAIGRIMAVKTKYLKPIIEGGQESGIFTSKVKAEELLHLCMGSMRLEMFKWRVSEFQFDLAESGETMVQSLLTLMKCK